MLSKARLYKKLLSVGVMIAAGFISANTFANPAPDFTLLSSTGENVRLA